MARRGKKDGRRDVLIDLTTPSLTAPTIPVVRTVPRIVRVPSRPKLSRLILIEDRRLWSPETRLLPTQKGLQRRTGLRTVSGVPTYRLKAKPSPRLSVPRGIAFGEPNRLVLCIRRKQRKEVLHALRKTGKGVKRRNPKRNYWSSISC